MELCILEIGGFPHQLSSGVFQRLLVWRAALARVRKLWRTLEQDAQNDPGAQCPLLEAEMLWSHRLART